MIFWARDITSEHHGTPVQILITVYTLNLFSSLLSSCYYYYPLSLVFDPLQTTRPERLTTSLNFIGSKVICVCAGPGKASDSFQTAHHLPNHLLITLGVLRETL